VKEIRASLRELARIIIPFNETFSHARGADRIKIRVSVEFVQAWPHWLMALVCSLQDIDKSERLINDTTTLLKEGMKLVIQDLSKKPLIDRSVVLPLELVSLISLRLLQDVTPGVLDISKTYSAALEVVVSTP
jgi:hypothetical protein